ncbi:MAG TPA: rhodanese-like domain-containing protein [Gemmatimonadales bacterium]
MLALLATLITIAPKGPDTSLVVSAQWLKAHLADPTVVVIFVDHSSMGGGDAFEGGHIKGARQLDYMAVGVERNNVSLELPAPDSIQKMFEALGVSDNSHVILTGAPLVATRTFFTLDYFGLAHVSILAGGLPAWRAAGGAVETGAMKAVTRGRLTPHPRPGIVASADDVLHHIGKAGTSFIDTRTEGEYLGTSERHGLQSEGHVDGARLLEWQTMFTDPNEFTPKDVATLKGMWAERVAPGDTVITYCAIGYRASGSYFMSRYLGYAARLFDGSYDEWSQKKMPTVKTVTPPRAATTGGAR